MKSLFLITFLFAQTLWAAGLPKKAVLVLQLDQPAVTVEFPQIDLAAAKISASGVAEFANTGSITVGEMVYQMGPKLLLNLKDQSKGFTADNIKTISYQLYSTDLNVIVGHLVVTTETGVLAVYKTNLRGKVTEWY